MPKMRVDRPAVVIARPGLHVTYQPGEHLAPDAHIVDVVRQGKGERLTSRGEGRARALNADTAAAEAHAVELPSAEAPAPESDAER